MTLLINELGTRGPTAISINQYDIDYSLKNVTGPPGDVTMLSTSPAENLLATGDRATLFITPGIIVGRGECLLATENSDCTRGKKGKSDPPS